MTYITTEILEKELRLHTTKIHLNIKQISELLEIDEHMAGKMMRPYPYFPGNGHCYLIPQIAEAYVDFLKKENRKKKPLTDEPLIKVERAKRRNAA